uniref:Sulfotransferase n=1 Tax=Fagus sylvatica TaxID=28930 RepID=A0A2N9HT78_FAGSY
MGDEEVREMKWQRVKKPMGDEELREMERRGGERVEDEEDTLVIKPPKKSPLILRMVVLLFVMGGMCMQSGPVLCDFVNAKIREWMTMDKVYRLDWFTSASKNECSAAVGFKWMLNQGLMEHHKEIVEYFKKRGVSAIFLFRKNLLRRMISVLANTYDKAAKPLNGTHKSHVHSPVEAHILAKYKPTINKTLLIPELKRTEETTAKAIEYFKSTRHIVLNYEDLINNRTKLKEVQEFLWLPYRDLTSRQVRIHTAPLSRQVQNWEDVRKALKGTSYESFLYAN